jgi:lysophospholipase L1-like esterase
MAVDEAKSDAADPYMYDGILELNVAMKELCAELDVPCLDLAADFPDGDGIFQDAVHMTPDGCRLKAERIADVLVGQLP